MELVNALFSLSLSLSLLLTYTQIPTKAYVLVIEQVCGV